MAETKSSTKTPTSAGAAPQSSGPSLSQRVAGFFRPPAGSGGSLMRRRTSSTTRFIVGSITFILVAELLTYLIDFANLKFKLNLNQPIVGASASWLTWFFLINVVVILGLWILLNKMGFFPRDLWAPRNSATARGGTASGNGAGSKKGNNDAKSGSQIPGIGKTRTRAERRYTTATAAAAATTKSANDKGRVTTNTDKRASVDDAAGDEHGAAYDRAKAAQRLRMRRARR